MMQGLKTFHIARHGETDYNRGYIFQGSSDIELNSKGFEQARGLLEDIRKKGVELDLIVSSPYKRARQTAQVVADGLGLDVVVVEGIRERHLGILEGARADKIHELFPEFWDEHKDQSFYDYFSIPEGENLDELELRVASAVKHILDNYGHLRLLVVTHGFAARMIHKFFGYDVKELKLLNCELVSYDIGRVAQRELEL